MWAALRVAAARIIAADWSMAVIWPSTSRSQTSVAATPWPHPTSSTRADGPGASTSTAHTSRSDGGRSAPVTGTPGDRTVEAST